MAFGKLPVPEEVRERLKENATDKLVHQTEKKMLRVPPRGTPLGDAAFISATERTMTQQPKPCIKCGKPYSTVAVHLTDTCDECWNKSLFA